MLCPYSFIARQSRVESATLIMSSAVMRLLRSSACKIVLTFRSFSLSSCLLALFLAMANLAEHLKLSDNCCPEWSIIPPSSSAFESKDIWPSSTYWYNQSGSPLTIMQREIVAVFGTNEEILFIDGDYFQSRNLDVWLKQAKYIVFNYHAFSLYLATLLDRSSLAKDATKQCIASCDGYQGKKASLRSY